ncbi:hypothetical protein BJX76DRAFT_320810, partial [Aspergillus varians]
MSFQNMLAGAVKDHFNKDDNRDDNRGNNNNNNNYNDNTNYNDNNNHNNNNNNNYEFNSAASHASAHSSEDSSLFSQALKFVQDRKSNSNSNDDIDEDHAVNAHKRYEQGGANMDSRDLGAGAALQALKKFTSGSGENTGGGKDQNAFVGLAMAQAGKMWEEKNGKGEVSGDKQGAVNQAAEMAIKMYMKSQMSGSGGTGGPSGLMSLAGKFL